MIGIPNVKLMDLIVFLSGYLMGLVPGILVGVLTWLVYGTLNPFGFNLIILAATCSSETIYAVFGWLLKKLNIGSDIITLLDINGRKFWFTSLKFGLIGFLATSIYDLITNIASVVIVGLSPIMAIISGVWFALIHEVSNFAFFFFGCIPLITALKKVLPEKEVIEL
ncbi:MAG: hypothetical protein QXV19_02410 [Candidatus Bathyarchaeia archaeon]